MRFADHVKGFILAVIVISLFIYGYTYYRYTQDDPDFCASCHLVKGAHADWLNGKHRDVLCQKCHQLGNIEQNLRLMSYVITGKNPITVTHGRTTPWQECKNCHMDIISQGSVTPSKSYGHAKHYAVKKIDCKTCHIPTLHNFPPNEDACQKCHQDKGVHGISMEEFSCLKCHSFSRKPPSMVSKDKCIRCHSSIPKKGPMSGLFCHYCHKMHTRVKPTAITCTTGCHRTEAALGQHGLHTKRKIGCIYCHKSHTWTIGESKTRILCSECHSYRDPRAFRYIF